METAQCYDVQMIPLKDIFADSDFNCRGEIAPIDVVDLAKDIEQSVSPENPTGLQSPIIVQPYDKVPGKKYRIVAGHRRYESFKILKRSHIPAFVRTDLTDLAARILNLGENLKRKDLNPVQEARALDHLKQAGMGQEEVAARLGMSRGWVQVRFMILDMPEDIQNEIAAGLLNQHQIREIHMMPTEDQYKAVKAIKEAKERGEKAKPVIKKRGDALRKRIRKPPEIFVMIEHIMEALGGANLATRALAWSAGEISDMELFRDIREEAEAAGRRYEVPKEALSLV